MKKIIKKIIAIILAAVTLFALAACGTTNEPATLGSTQSTPESTAAKNETSNSNAASETEQTTEPGAETKILVVYFSRTGEQYTVGTIDKGNTAIVAEMIAEKTGADLYEILPETDYYPYTYKELTDVAKKEQNDNARPKIKGELPDVSKYDTVFIGAPVWWGDWPMIMYTFFEQNADGLSGKKLVPFSTHEGSGLSGFDRKLESACPNSTVLDGLAIRGNDCQNKQDSVRSKVSDWMSGLE